MTTPSSFVNLLLGIFSRRSYTPKFMHKVLFNIYSHPHEGTPYWGMASLAQPSLLLPQIRVWLSHCVFKGMCIADWPRQRRQLPDVLSGETELTRVSMSPRI